MENIIYFTILTFFFAINLLFTQQIYSKGWIYFLLMFSLLPPLSVIVLLPLKQSLQLFSFSLILIYYSILLLLIKRNYKSMNSFLIRLSIMEKKFKHKDFSYLNWNSSNPTTSPWWNNKLADPPSPLDIILTVSLIVMPFLLYGLTSFILKHLFNVQYD